MKATIKYHWGDDLEVVNNARVSFAAESKWELRCTYCGIDIDTKCNGHCGRGLEEKKQLPCIAQFQSVLSQSDHSLIQFLARGCSSNDWEKFVAKVRASDLSKVDAEGLLQYIKDMPTHWTPFANGVGTKFHIKAPIPIMRQVFKHKVGTVENEISRRYVDDEPEVFYPLWRKKAENIKQGSSEELLDEEEWEEACLRYNHSVNTALAAYEAILDAGVCPEQARFVLPQGMESEAIVSNSLYGWAKFCIQRGDRNHAQREVADLADDIEEEMQKRFPVSWGALKKSIPSIALD